MTATTIAAAGDAHAEERRRLRDAVVDEVGLRRDLGERLDALDGDLDLAGTASRSSRASVTVGSGTISSFVTASPPATAVIAPSAVIEISAAMPSQYLY